MKNLLNLLCLLILMFGVVNGQKPSDALSKEEKARLVIEQSIQVIDKNSKLKGVTSLFFKTEQVGPLERPLMEKEEFSIKFPNQLKIVRVSNETTNFVRTWSGDKYREGSEMYVGDKVYRQSDLIAQLTPEQKAKLKERSDKWLPKEFSDLVKQTEALPNDPKTNFLGKMWYHIFPVLLIASFEPTAKFEFVGKAEAGEQRADVIDVKSDYYRKFRLFFDEKTHLLLMMTVRLEKSEGFFDEKYYFSNYTLMDGLMIPKTIMNQNEDLTKEGKLVKKYVQNFTTIEEFKLNPQFGKNIFEVD
jgi:hypothetical protein